MNKVKSNLKNKLYIGLLLALGVIYFFFVGEIGYVMEADSLTFITMDLKNYRLYTGFLNVCENIFGEILFLHIANIVQGVFAIIVSLVVTFYFARRYRLNKMETLLIYIATFLPYGYSLPQSVATHHILTEGLSFSFFHLFCLVVVIVFLDKKIYMMLPAGLLLLLMIWTRSQLLLLVPVYIVIWIALGLCCIYKKISDKTKKIFWTCLIVLSILVCMLIIPMMKLIIQKGFMPQFVEAMSGRVFCTIEESDIEYVDEQFQGVCQYLYEKIDEKETREVYFRDGLRRWEDILYSANENTKGVTNWINEYYSLGGEEESRPGQEINYLTAVLFERHLESYIEMTITLCIQSFVVSIFIHPDAIYTLCHIITLFIYLMTFLLVIISVQLKGKEEARIPLYLTGFMLIANVVITNLFFFGQQRYVVYTFGFFYISLFLLCRDIWMIRKEEQ